MKKVLFTVFAVIVVSIVGSYNFKEIRNSQKYINLEAIYQLPTANAEDDENITEHTCVVGWDESPTFPFLKRRCPNCMSDFTNESYRSTCMR